MTEPASPETASTPSKTTHRFEAEVEQVLRLVVHSLYSNKEIFLRELLSNASDALDKLRFRALTEPGLLPPDDLRIRIETDAQARTLTISDNGVGMSKDELVSHLGTIAKSGSRELLEKLKASTPTSDAEAGAGKSPDLTLIGQFGVGFYSAFLVADRVAVVSRAAGTDRAWRWESDATRSFTIEPAERDTNGTSVILHLAPDHIELLRSWKLEELARTYSDYLQWPIEVRLDREKSTDLADAQWKRVNRGSALWQRSPSDIAKEEYEKFYEHLAHDATPPLAWRHFKVEGNQEFAGLLYAPRRAPFDLFAPDTRKGVRLYVKRVFIMEDCDEVLPRWLRFVRGVIDSEDLPLNVSREILQDSRLTRVIRKQVVKQALDMLGELADRSPEEYAHFWKTFGAVLKEGLHYEPEQAERIAKLLRYESTAGTGLVSLADYKARMKEGQKAIYYVLGETPKQVASSPHLEGFAKRGYEVLTMTDAIDGFAVPSLREFDGVPLMSATAAELDLGEDGSEKPEATTAFEALRARCRVRLQEHVSEVRASTRLIDSPSCLVIPDGGLAPHLERMLRASQLGASQPEQKRIFELNPQHALIRSLAELIEKRPDLPTIDEWIDLLFEQALVAEGSPIDDPGRFTRRITALLTDAATRAAQ